MTSILKETREKNGYTIEEVSEILKIRKQYIISLEEENFDNLPGDIYVKGYSKIYYEFLGLEMPKQADIINNGVKLNVDVKLVNSLKKYMVAFICMLILIGVSIIYYILEKDDDSNNSDLVKNSIIYDDENNETTFDQSY
ncbi:MAG: helix-turn-helix domain-containing protein [Rickettsiales bacterium]|nr:MAG: helix-turn-helix domain-containing protein [Rickettsiales bacterium]